MCTSAQVLLELSQMWFQTEGEEERRQRVALVDSTCGRESVAMASGIPEEVLGCPAREHVCTGDELRRVAFQFAEALISVSRAERVRSTRSASASVSVLAVWAKLSAPAGTPTANWWRPKAATTSFCPGPAEVAPGETAQEARGGDGTHTAARLVESREFGGRENLRSAFWQVRGSHAASNLVERIKCSR